MSYAPMGGLSALLKDGTKHVTAADDAVMRNIDACKQLGAIVRTSIGPNGMNKMVTNRLGKLFVTSDAATIVRELEVVHPAAKLLVMAAETQDREVGDGTGFVITFGAQLMSNAALLIKMGLHTAEIIQGYGRAAAFAMTELEAMSIKSVTDPADREQVAVALRSAIASKLFGMEDFLAGLVAEACVSVLPKNQSMFSVENVRVAKVHGGSLNTSSVVKGSVLIHDVEGTIKHLKNAKIAMYTCDVDAEQTETKGTVLLNSAEEFANYNRSEEDALEKRIKDIANTGANVIVGPKFGDMALHFIERYKMMAIRVPSKFDLRRIARTTGAVVLAKLVPPSPEEIGACDSVGVEEIGSTKCTIFRQDSSSSRIATIIVRASTENLLDDVERAIDDAVNVYKNLTRDQRLVCGAGATEMELARLLYKYAETLPSLDQYSIKKYAAALEEIPRCFAENSGGNATELMNTLQAVHADGDAQMGVDVENAGIMNAAEKNVYDLLSAKLMAIRLTTDAVTTILRIDQIVMSKEAGGPKPRDMMAGDYNDETAA
ncbi:T-complex protein 1 subunit theta [Porphyridium purpureum]|uniref:CCT-theta n=1 Tax=Porphyridium purpureum TaxID=35688 RepID=A0A5J4YM76_PORPP|nr:T-complex protein 1 subunit theta [Porphyridium purpureum]|eukprot:POR0365..scf244_11